MLGKINILLVFALIMTSVVTVMGHPDDDDAVNHGKARSVKIVDAENRTRIRVFVDERGTARLQMLDRQGNVTVSLHCAAEEVDAALVVQNGRTSTTLSIDQKKAGIVAARRDVEGEPDATASMQVWNATTNGVDCVTRLEVSLPGGEHFTQISVKANGEVVTEGLQK